MLARWQRLLVLAALAAALAWLVLGWRHGVAPGWLAAGLLPILLPQAPVLALEFVLLAAFGRDPAVPRATAAQLLRAWAGEVLVAWQVFGWRQPFRPGREPDVPAAPGRTAVLMVHGYCCNRGLWAPWMHRLRAHGVPCTALTLEPVFGGIDDWVPAIDAAVADLRRRTGRAPLLVAHSMGGLAVRAWLASGQGHDADGTARVRQVLTIGTPHHGTWMARFGHTRNARQMRRGSPWLQDLARREAALAAAGRAVPFTCFYGHADNIVFPAGTAMLAGADNRHLAGSAHVQMVFEPAPLAEVLRLLGGPA